MGVYVCRRYPWGTDLMYPVDLNHKMAESWRYYGDYLFDFRQSDFGFNAYWQAYQENDQEALISIGLLLLSYGFEEEGKKSIIHGYTQSQSAKALYTYIKCILLFDWPDTIDIEKQVTGIVHHPDEEAFDFLVWYYQYIHETEHSITAFLQLKNEANQLKWLSYYLSYMLKLGKDIYGQAMIKHLKDKYPKAYTKELVKAHLDAGSYRFVVDFADDNPGLALYQSIAYYRMNQIISSVDAANKIKLERLTPEERCRAYHHMAVLAEVGSDYRTEAYYLEALVTQWKQEERYIKKEIQAHRLRFCDMDQA